MSATISNLRPTIVPKSDQTNAEQLLAGPLTITVTDVRIGSAEQPVIIGYEGDNGRPYKPCLTMRKVLIFAWGEDGRQWVGKSMTLYNDPTVRFGGAQVGGIRISHMSDIPRDIGLSLTATKGKKAVHTVKPLEARTARKQATPTGHEQEAQAITKAVREGDAAGRALALSLMDDDARNAVWRLLDDETASSLTAAWPA